MVAVQESGLALRCAAQELKRDPEIVLAAVQQDGKALEFADQKLQDDCHRATFFCFSQI